MPSTHGRARPKLLVRAAGPVGAVLCCFVLHVGFAAGAWTQPAGRASDLSGALCGRRGRANPPRILRRALDPFALLGVESTATRDEVKKAFRERIRKAHPDAGGSTEEFKQVREAYQEALSRVGFNVPGGSRAGGGASQSQRPGWTLRDFYKWRREQVQQEKDVWEQDAEARSQHWWSSAEKRAQQRKGAASASQEPPKTVREQNARMRRQHQARRKQRLRERQDDSVMEWDAFLKRTNNGKVRESAKSETQTRSGPPRARRNADRVVTHRSIATLKGEERVPVFQDEGGTCYYVSPTTRRKVVVPK
ncbi:dnaJ [Symbiodinium natans]|uniref:DnaJ protein n=1 Tax=Symbiodinium natans TaxID=878477 RepID=A0A812PEX5_9DINO|nr:dnaJ [Symbiodinium natans]